MPVGARFEQALMRPRTSSSESGSGGSLRPLFQAARLVMAHTPVVCRNNIATDIIALLYSIWQVALTPKRYSITYFWRLTQRRHSSRKVPPVKLPAARHYGCQA